MISENSFATYIVFIGCSYNKNFFTNVIQYLVQSESHSQLQYANTTVNLSSKCIFVNWINTNNSIRIKKSFDDKSNHRYWTKASDLCDSQFDSINDEMDISYLSENLHNLADYLPTSCYVVHVIASIPDDLDDAVASPLYGALLRYSEWHHARILLTSSVSPSPLVDSWITSLGASYMPLDQLEDSGNDCIGDMLWSGGLRLPDQNGDQSCTGSVFKLTWSKSHSTCQNTSLQGLHLVSESFLDLMDVVDLRCIHPHFLTPNFLELSYLWPLSKTCEMGQSWMQHILEESDKGFIFSLNVAPDDLHYSRDQSDSENEDEQDHSNFVRWTDRWIYRFTRKLECKNPPVPRIKGPSAELRLLVFAPPTPPSNPLCPSLQVRLLRHPSEFSILHLPPTPSPNSSASPAAVEELFGESVPVLKLKSGENIQHFLSRVQHGESYLDDVENVKTSNWTSPINDEDISEEDELEIGNLLRFPVGLVERQRGKTILSALKPPSVQSSDYSMGFNTSQVLGLFNSDGTPKSPINAPLKYSPPSANNVPFCFSPSLGGDHKWPAPSLGVHYYRGVTSEAEERKMSQNQARHVPREFASNLEKKVTNSPNPTSRLLRSNSATRPGCDVIDPIITSSTMSNSVLHDRAFVSSSAKRSRPQNASHALFRSSDASRVTVPVSTNFMKSSLIRTTSYKSPLTTTLECPRRSSLTTDSKKNVPFATVITKKLPLASNATIKSSSSDSLKKSTLTRDIPKKSSLASDSITRPALVRTDSILRKPSSSASSGVSIVPANESKSSENESRSQRHNRRLVDVVKEVVESKGLQPTDAKYKVVVQKLFDTTKTIIKMQKLSSSKGLREQMKQFAELQAPVIFHLENIKLQ